MQLEHLAIAARPRAGWEAIDLGFSMARQWWRPLWLTWLSVYLPAALVLHLLLWDWPWVAILILWWFHPLFERAVMHAVGHAAFGATPTVMQTLRAAGEWLRPGLFAALTLYRADLARTLMLPVWQLEQQRGKEARLRRKLLGKRLRGYAVWLTFVCGIFVFTLYRGLVLIPEMLEPASTDPDFNWGGLIGADSAEQWNWKLSLCLVLAYSMVQPFYVCAGFALYLNRRATLEGWDIEIALRKLARRFAQGATLLILSACLISISVPNTYAAEQERAAQTIKKVLKDPAFEEYKQGKRWQYRGESKKEKEAEKPSEFLVALAQALARAVQVFIWVGAAVIVFYLVRAAMRHWGWRGAKVEAYRPPEVMFGLELKPESLPDDVAATASALLHNGKIREALSLLYRGALSALVHRKQVRLSEGDTEGDCLRAARGILTLEGTRYF
ncbi:MAG TPA: hypothetical protein VJM53_05010, partial [Burkholderiales bacterium]|nr:hypothetical protein [Burkholderiales bacterium]